MTDGDLRMLGTRDGLAHALIWCREQIDRIDGIYAPRLQPWHSVKIKRRNDILSPLRELEQRLAKAHAETQAAYNETTK